jgi:hypothetical protein
MSPKAGVAFLMASVGVLSSCHRTQSVSAQAPEAGARSRNQTATAPVQASAPPRGKLLTLLYSSNMFGEYEPCG